MAVPKAYLTSTKNVPDILTAIHVADGELCQLLWPEDLEWMNGGLGGQRSVG